LDLCLCLTGGSKGLIPAIMMQVTSQAIQKIYDRACFSEIDACDRDAENRGDVRAA